VAARGRELLLKGGSDTATMLGKLMDENFALRRRMYTDAALGALNIRMVKTPLGQRTPPRPALSRGSTGLAGLPTHTHAQPGCPSRGAPRQLPQGSSTHLLARWGRRSGVPRVRVVTVDVPLATTASPGWGWVRGGCCGRV